MEDASRQAEEICILLKRVSNLFNRLREPSSGAPGVMGSGYMLSLLSESPEMNQRELVQLMQVRPASASEMLHKMEQEGMIHRRTDPKDRRGVLVSLTARGLALEEESRNRRREVSERLLEALSPEEREALRELLRKLFLAYVSGNGASEAVRAAERRLPDREI